MVKLSTVHGYICDQEFVFGSIHPDWYLPIGFENIFDRKLAQRSYKLLFVFAVVAYHFGKFQQFCNEVTINSKSEEYMKFESILAKSEI